jgi:hypothetical protein
LSIQSAGVNEKGSRTIPKWCPISEIKEHRITTMQAKNQAIAIFPTSLISHYPLPLMNQIFSLSGTGKRTCRILFWERLLEIEPHDFSVTEHLFGT